MAAFAGMTNRRLVPAYAGMKDRLPDAGLNRHDPPLLPMKDAQSV
jgi:hypothetical protein